MKQIAALLALALALSTHALEALAEGGLDRLRRAAARHPGDADLAWALARHLAEAELHAQAVEVLRNVIRLDPELAYARLQLGMSLERLGRFAEAYAQLDAAAELEPQLRPQTLLVRGVSLIERGQEEEGFRLLERVVELDPLGDVADAARLVLAERRPAPPRLRLQAYGGLDYDSNATLDSGSTPGLSSDESDGAGVWGAIASGDLLRGEAHRLSLGARYHERDYFDIDSLDERTFLGFLSGHLGLGSRAALRLTAVGSYAMLDDESYLTQAKLLPELMLRLGPRAGVLQLGASVEGHYYEDDPLLPSLERDAVSYGGELNHLFEIPGFDGVNASWGASYERMKTDARRDPLGFRGDYDHQRYGGHLGLEVPLPCDIGLEVSAGAGGEAFDHDNLIDFLAQLQSGGGAQRRKRRDTLLWTDVALSRPILEHVDLEIRWRFQDRSSNTDVFDYERHVAGALLRVRSF